MTQRSRIRQEVRSIKQVLKTLRAEQVRLLEEMGESELAGHLAAEAIDFIGATCNDLCTALTTLRWVLWSTNERGPPAPSFGLLCELMQGYSSPSLVDALDRVFEEDGRWPLERN